MSYFNYIYCIYLLALPIISYGQTPHDYYEDIISKNSKEDIPNLNKVSPIIDSAKYAFLKTYIQPTENFDYLDEIVKNHRIIFIGENRHGVEDFSTEKIKIIDYLAQKHGYKTLVFESGLVECHSINVQKDLNPDSALIKRLIPGWQTSSMLHLFEVLRKNKMNFEGLGVQKNKVEDSFYKNCLLKYTPKNATFFIQSDTIFTWVYKHFKFQKGNNTNKMIEHFDTDKHFYKTAAFFKKLYSNELEKLQKAKYRSVEVQIIERTIQRKLSLANRLIEREKNPVNGHLDEEMLEDLDFITNELYPAEKTIVWIHNDYIVKLHSETKNADWLGNKWHNNYKNKSYMIGFHFLEGDYNQGQKDLYFRVKKVEYNSLPAIIGSISSKSSCFINLSEIPKNKTTKPIFEPIEEHLYGRAYIPKQIIPNRYDGIFFIRRVSVPNFLKR